MLTVNFAITGVSPSSGSYLGGMEVTVSGAGFHSDMEVMIGSSPCGNLNVAADGNTATCITTPASTTYRVDNMGQHPSKYQIYH